MTETLTSLFKRGVSSEAIEAHLDVLGSAHRLAEVRAFPGRLLTKLFDASGKRPCHLADVVPMAGTAVTYAGKNSAPAFKHFSKILLRHGDTNEVIGRNAQFWSAFSGPGYFVAYDEGDQVIFDYTREPSFRPAGWPEIKPNRGLIASPAFGGMIDHNRWVSSNTIVGRGYKNGRLFAHYLVTRIDPTLAGGAGTG